MRLEGRGDLRTEREQKVKAWAALGYCHDLTFLYAPDEPFDGRWSTTEAIVLDMQLIAEKHFAEKALHEKD